MNEHEQRAVLTLVLMAAFADGQNDPLERAEVSRVAQSLSQDGSINVASIYQDVLLKRTSLESAAATLTTPDVRRLAYELCVGACAADGAQREEEKAFLASLSRALGFDPAQASSAEAFSARADALVSAPVATASSAEPPRATGRLSAADEDRLIQHYAVLNGALELLPDSLASMAIIPLQMRMVHRIGQSYGVELDRSSIMEFLGAAGIGLASQHVERIGVSLVGKLFGRGIVGGLLGSLARQSVSSGFSFATTHALGRLAARYYAAGRTLSAQVLKDTYDGLLREAKGLEQGYLPAIQEKARTINVQQLLNEVRGVSSNSRLT